MTVYVYGVSDDLIEIEGSLTEEFNYIPPTYSHHDPKPYYLGFSDGTLLKITYDGEWNIKPVYPTSSKNVTMHSAGLASVINTNVPSYSDLAIIHSDVTWAVGGKDVVK